MRSDREIGSTDNASQHAANCRRRSRRQLMCKVKSILLQLIEGVHLGHEANAGTCRRGKAEVAGKRQFQTTAEAVPEVLSRCRGAVGSHRSASASDKTRAGVYVTFVDSQNPLSLPPEVDRFRSVDCGRYAEGVGVPQPRVGARRAYPGGDFRGSPHS
jgi:hypothetical protein